MSAHRWLAAAAAIWLLATGCGRQDTSTGRSAGSDDAGAPVFRVLATSDLRDALPLQEMVEKATGVKLRFTFGGTMESTEAVLAGKADADAAWFANARYLLSDAQGQSRVKLQEKIALSPIAVGVSESAANQLHWTDPAIADRLTWKDIAAAAKAGKLTYALSNPATSNQWFMALMGVVAAPARKPRR